jgi:hypothetical protein
MMQVAAPMPRLPPVTRRTERAIDVSPALVFSISPHPEEAACAAVSKDDSGGSGTIWSILRDDRFAISSG